VRAREVGLLRLATQAGGVSEECTTGLQAHKLDVVVVGGAAAAAGAGVSVLVIDAGDRFEEARAALAELRSGAPGCRAVVCIARLDTDRMNELVAAGAADVARYPVTPDALAKKLERVLRRGR
jgi:serine/threonine-protein kinase